MLKLPPGIVSYPHQWKRGGIVGSNGTKWDPGTHGGARKRRFPPHTSLPLSLSAQREGARWERWVLPAAVPGKGGSAGAVGPFLSRSRRSCRPSCCASILALVPLPRLCPGWVWLPLVGPRGMFCHPMRPNSLLPQAGFAQLIVCFPSPGSYSKFSQGFSPTRRFPARSTLFPGE